eukprot:GFYU01003318.1.p1 GENE.GFYU01003318.1~~GFYU01003318.1.p1  ORF type:complete len:343 (-),score=37.17 GFYU01003318.1:319-1347(-)
MSLEKPFMGAVSLACLWLVAIIASELTQLESIGLPIVQRSREWFTDLGLINVTKGVSLLGYEVLFVVMPLLLLVNPPSWKTTRVGFVLFRTQIIIYFIMSVLKAYFGRDRPLAYLDGTASVEGHMKEFSFPSGHAMGTMSGMMLIADQTDVIAYKCALYTVVLIVSATRVILAAHFPHDVVAGWCLGYALTNVRRYTSLIEVGFLQRKPEMRKSSLIVLETLFWPMAALIPIALELPPEAIERSLGLSLAPGLLVGLCIGELMMKVVARVPESPDTKLTKVLRFLTGVSGVGAFAYYINQPGTRPLVAFGGGAVITVWLVGTLVSFHVVRNIIWPPPSQKQD